MSKAEFMGEIKIKSTAEIVKECKVAGKSKEEAWNEAYGAVSNRGWHQEMLFSVDGAVDLLRNFAHRLTSFNDMELSESSVEAAVNFLTSEDAIKYYKTQGKIPTIRTLGKVATAIECGLSLDTDTLINYTECPAY